MKKVNAVSNTSASAGKIVKASVQKSHASGGSHISATAKSKQRITSDQSFENRDSYSELFRLVGSGVAVYQAIDKGKDFIITDFNQAAEKIEKTSRKKVIGRKVTEVFPGIREMSLLKTFQRVWKTGKPEYHPAAVYKGESLKSWRENYVYKLPSGQIMAIYEDITERKQAEERIADEATRRRILIDQSRDGIVILDTNGSVYETNKRFAEMLGYTPKEVMGLHVWDWDFKLPQKQIIHMIREVDETGDHFETQHKRKDGSVFDVAISTNGSMFAGQKLIFCVCRDITERKRTEMQLRESEERFRSLYENATIGIYRTTPDGKVLTANKALLKMLGFQSFEAMAKRNLNSEGYEPKGSRQNFMRQIEAEGEVHGFESTWKTQKNSTVYVRESARVIRDKKGKVLFYEGTVEDISGRHQAEKTLKDNEIFLNSVIENIPNMVFVKDVPDLRFVRLNKAGEELLGFSSQSMYSKNDNDFFPPEEAQHFISKDKETLLKRLLLDIPEEKIKTKNKGERILHTKKIPILDAVGNPKYLLGISEDITERKQSERALLILSDTQRQMAQVDTPEELYQLVGNKLLELVPESYIVFSVLDEAQQATRPAGLFGFGPVYEKLKKTYKIDPAKYVYPQKDMTPEEVRLFRSGRLEEFPGGIYALMVRTIPKSICEIGEKQLKIKKIYTQGLVYQGNYLGVIAILARGDITPLKDMIEIVIQQASITFNRIKSRTALEESEERFRGLFEDSPISLWEEDFSAVKQRLDELKAKGASDLYTYLKSHPEEVVKCASLIKILDVNKAALKLYGAKDKEHLIDNLTQIVSIESSAKFIDELVNISNGLTRFNYETVNQAIGGRKINISISWTAAPGYEKELSKVLLSIVDITERKQAEAKMDNLITELRDLSETEKKNRIFAEALAKNVSAINSSLKDEEVMDSIIDSISEIVPYDAASVMMVNGQQARIVRSKGYREKGLEKWVEQTQFDLNKIKDFTSIIRNKKYKVTPNTETSEDWTVVAETAWVKSHITSPLIDGNQVIGFLNLDSATPGYYTEEHAKELMSFSEQVSTALRNARLFEETRRRMDRMQAMTQIDLAINSSLDINVSLEIVLIQAKDKLKADAVDILQVNNGTNSLVFSKAKGFKTDEIRKANFRLGTGLPGRAVLDRALIAIPDLRSAPESYFRNLLVEREGFTSYYCAPLVTKGELKGVMEIYFREQFNADQEWREFLEMLAQQTAIAINNAELLNSLKVSNADLINAYETTLRGWVDALDMRDHETEGHTRRVTELSLQLSLRMGIKDSEIVNFERGALLHDIGKVGIADSILNKPGPLTEEEWVIMRKHPLYAFQLLSKSKYLIPALDIPYCHHEKWDGSGYPRGLKGEAIPFAARIFAIVDVWDALISDRPYRSAWTQKQALDHIQEQSGKHFDPKVVSAFNSLPKTEFKK